MMSQPGKQTIARHILPNISRSTGNQKIKFGKLIEHNFRKRFLEKPYNKIAKPFSKKPKIEHISGSIV